MLTRSWKITVAATLLLALVNCGLLLRQQFICERTMNKSEQNVRQQITDLERKLEALKKQLDEPKTRLLSQNTDRVHKRN